MFKKIKYNYARCTSHVISGTSNQVLEISLFTCMVKNIEMKKKILSTDSLDMTDMLKKCENSTEFTLFILFP